MEVGNQAVNHLELIAWINKDVRPAASCMKNTLIIRCRFQGTAAGGSHRYDLSTSLLCLIDQLRLIFFHDIELGMHMMIRDIFYLYRAEGSETYMQSYMCNIYTFGFDRFQKLRCKM